MTEPGRRALVIVAHPDDAEITVGGTIAQLVDSGVEVVSLVLSMPEAAPGATARQDAATQAAQALGYRLRWPSGEILRQVVDLGEIGLVRLLDQVVAEEKPRLVLSHWDGDSHADHVLTARAVMATLRTTTCQLYQFRPGELRTPAFARFQPTAFVDISAVADRKATALKPYGVSRAGFRALDLDAIEQVDRMHGAMAGVDRAEGFVVARQYGLAGVPG